MKTTKAHKSDLSIDDYYLHYAEPVVYVWELLNNDSLWLWCSYVVIPQPKE